MSSQKVSPKGLGSSGRSLFRHVITRPRPFSFHSWFHMTNIVPFIFESQEIRTITHEDGTPWFVLRDLLAAMGSSTKTTDAAESINQGLGKGFANDLPLLTAGGPQTMTVIAEAAATFLLSRSNTEAGRRLNRYIHTEVLPSIRRTGSYAATPAQTPAPNRPYEFWVADLAIQHLKMSETSKIRMMQDLCAMRGVPSIFLPKYSDETLVRALTALLKEHGSPLSAKAANQMLIGMGLLEELERMGSKGIIKTFKSLTTEGLKYGRNETSPQEPRETQPLYYVDKFQELLSRINAYQFESVTSGE